MDEGTWVFIQGQQGTGMGTSQEEQTKGVSDHKVTMRVHLTGPAPLMYVTDKHKQCAEHGHTRLAAPEVTLKAKGALTQGLGKA